MPDACELRELDAGCRAEKGKGELMKPHLITAASALALLVIPTIASAQDAERTWTQRTVPAPSQAFEATVGTGYTQPFGLLRSGVGMPDVAKAGIGIDAAVGYRIDPHWGLSVGGQYQELNAQNADASRGAAFTFAAQYHIVPTTRLDPWLELALLRDVHPRRASA
jgi:hypothetical protein